MLRVRVEYLEAVLQEVAKFLHLELGASVQMRLMLAVSCRKRNLAMALLAAFNIG